MSIAEKLQIIAENEQKVYDAGYAKGKAEGGSDSMIGTYVIHEAPSIAGELGFDTAVVGKYYYYDGESFVETDLTRISLDWNEEYTDGGISLCGVGTPLTEYYFDGHFWTSNGYNFFPGTDTTLLRTFILTEEPTDENLLNLREWLKKNATFTPRTYENGFEDGRNSAVDADKIIETAITGIDSVYIKDVSEVKHNIKIETTAGAKVTVLGKNLIPNFVTNQDLTNGSMIRVNDDGGITVHKVAGDPINIKTTIELEEGSYALSDGINAKKDIYFQLQNKTTGEYIVTLNGNATKQFPKGEYDIIFYSARDKVVDATIYPQLEKGRAASVYEPYKIPTEYIADENGNVTIASISPNMNIFTEGEFSVEYRRSWGMQTEYDRFWDALQNGGSPSNYAASFGAAWTEESFRPKYNLVPINAYMMFRQNQMNIDLVEHLEKLGVVLDTSQCDSFSYMFSSSKFTRIGVIDLSASTQTLPGDALFMSCSKLVTIDKIILKTGTRGEFGAACFNSCSALENLKLEGILTTDLDLHWSTKLSKESINSVLYAADESVNLEGRKHFTLTFSKAAVQKAFETAPGLNDGDESPDWKN